MIPLSIAFVGVGRMGANMARRLKDKGFAVAAIYDSRAQAAAELAAELGVSSCATLAEVTGRAQVVFTVVSDDAAQLSLFPTTGDSLLAGASGRLFINCATISPAPTSRSRGAHRPQEPRASRPAWPPRSPRHATGPST